MAISKIKLPDNSTQDIHDSRVLGVDSTPTADSGNLVTSGGVATALSGIPSTYAGSPSAGGPANKTLGIPFGYVDSTSTATVMTATVDNFPTILTAGVCAYIRNDVVASASGWTLNINGTGAKPVYASNADASRTTTVFSAASTFLFVYNSSRVSGGCWDVYYGYDSNTNTIGYVLRTNSMSLPVNGATGRYRLLFTSPDGTHFVPANTSSSTNATTARTVNQSKIDPFGSIRYYSYTTMLSAEGRPGVSYLCEQNTLTLGYSFNPEGGTLELTTWAPVYLKCAPQTDGSAIMDAAEPIVQALPSTEDGKIYIFLGVAYSATAMELVFHHPVYWYKDGMVRQWTNAAGGGSSDEALTSSEIQDIWDGVMGGVTLISFTILGTTYQAEDGMTWGEWVESEHNTGGYQPYQNGTTIHITQNGDPQSTVTGNGGVFVNPTDAIIDDASYSLTTWWIED